MPDHKTVTFDATLLPCPFCGGTDLEITNTHTASFWIVCNDCDAEAHGDYVEGPQRDDKFHYEASPDDSGFEAAYNDLYPEYQAAFRSAVVAWNTRAPTPAAQSAGQEAVFRLYKHDGDFDVEVQAGVFNKMPKGEYMLYAAPVNGGEPVAWAVFDSEHLVSTVVDPVARKTAESAGYTLRPLVYGDAAPVNGGERVTDALTNRKADDIAARDGYSFTGYVLTHPEHGQCIVNMSAVRWIKPAEFWKLMHPENRAADAPQVGSSFEFNHVGHSHTVYGDDAAIKALLQYRKHLEDVTANALKRTALSSPAKVGEDEREAFKEYRRGVREAFDLAHVIETNRQGRTAEETCAYILRRLAEFADRNDLAVRAALSADGGEDRLDAERWRKFLRVYTYYRWSLFDSPEEIIRELDATVVDPAIIAAKAKGDAQ